MKDKILILGDVHLGKNSNLGISGANYAYSSTILDQFFILDWVLEQAKDNDISHIVITGDVYEVINPGHSLIISFINWLKKCSSENISVHIIVGNHDILRAGQFYISPLDIVSAADIENVFIYNNISTLHLNGISITFLPFRDRRSFNVDDNSEAVKLLNSQLSYEKANNELNNIKMLIGHLALEGSIPIGDEIDEMLNELICPLSMFKGYDYVWMGHIHKHQILQKSPLIAHIGSMNISNFSECDHTKVIAIIDLNSNEQYKVITIPTRQYKSINIIIPKETENTTQYVINELSEYDVNRAILRLHIVLEDVKLSPTNRSEIEKYLYSKNVHNIARMSEERIKAITKKKNDNLDNTVTEKAAIKMYADTVIEDSFKEEFIKTANSIFDEYIASLSLKE